MPQDRPSAAELLAAIRDFLEREVQPTLDARTGFHLRVAINSLAILEREATLGPQADADELVRLRKLLGRSDGNLADLNAELARRLREGRLDEQDSALMAHLEATIRDKMTIANPRYK
jgi:hypothetical protein